MLGLILSAIILSSCPECPPGTVRINDYFIDQTEVTNLSWREMLYYIEQDSIESLQNYLPAQENVWYEWKEMRHHPVVYITYEQARDYCAWRSKKIQKGDSIEVTYRLPTKDEWLSIADLLVRSEPKRIRKEQKEAYNTLYPMELKYVTFARETPQTYGLDFFGNVSEMVAEKGIAMGMTNEDVRYRKQHFKKSYSFQGTNPYLGFRCIAEYSK